MTDAADAAGTPRPAGGDAAVDPVDPVDPAALVARLQAEVTAADHLPPTLFTDLDLADSLYAALNRMEAARFVMPFVAVDEAPAVPGPAVAAAGGPVAAASAAARAKGLARQAAKRIVGPYPGQMLRRIDALVDELFGFNRAATERIRTLEARVADLERRLGDVATGDANEGAGGPADAG